MKFSISGSILNDDYEYKDANADDAFTTISMFYSKASDPDLSDDQIQLYVGKSFMGGNFLLVAPPEKGIHQINYGAGNDFDLSINISPEEDYYAKQVSVNITALDISGSALQARLPDFFTEITWSRQTCTRSVVHLTLTDGIHC